ncbi:MAG TPA: FAD-dependent oxidoreductase [Nitrososphaerales archaeon]|nr:FAD-dependent oxidoreductase [Nitrososphaerales archaeon]
MEELPGRWARADILVVGAGILGATIAYWISRLYDCDIVLVDKERRVGAHASTRNTGVLHRPFYLNPKSKRTFARAAAISYPMWKALAKEATLPWLPIGTLSVAVSDEQVATLQSYREWGQENGMTAEEVPLLDAAETRSLEPEVSCRAALHSTTDVSVDFGDFTRHLAMKAEKQGVKFLGGFEVQSMDDMGDQLAVRFRKNESYDGVVCRFMINVAGGGALEIAHERGLAKGYAALCFRGDYWLVEEPFASKVRRNVYTPPRIPEFPFLDPHFVIRPSGTRQIGPNAALVTGPYVYSGFGISSPGSLLRPPIGPKLGLLTNGTFVSMVAGEWRSSLSKSAMCSRVNKFLPGLDSRTLLRRGISGVRSNVVDDQGFVHEAEILHDARSVHVLNYNSPGATGAPAYAAMLVKQMRSAGRFDGLTRKAEPVAETWSFDTAADFD